MAGPTVQDASASPLPTPIYPAPYTASPITPTGNRPRLTPRRQSRFTEEVMSERTPAASVSERSFDHWYGPSTENINASVTHNDNDDHNNNATLRSKSTSNRGSQPQLPRRDTQTSLRVANGILHALPCLVLVCIMGYAMRVLEQDLGSHMGIQAIILIFFLFMDVMLDLAVLFRAQQPWPTWALVLRFACGITYITHFLLYVGLGGVFPEGYTYWALPASFAAPLVYILLCVEGIWDLLHVPVCRYHLGSTLRKFIPSKTSGNTSPSTLDNTRTTSFNQRVSTVGTERSSISMTWHRWVRTPSTQYSREDLENLRGSGMRVVSGASTLREQPGEEEKEEGVIGGLGGAVGKSETGSVNGEEGDVRKAEKKEGCVKRAEKEEESGVKEHEKGQERSGKADGARGKAEDGGQ